MPFNKELGKPGYCRTCRSSMFVLERGGCAFCKGKERQERAEEEERKEVVASRIRREMLDASGYAGGNTVDQFLKGRAK